MRSRLLAPLLLLAGCRTPGVIAPPAPILPPTVADSVRSETVARGVSLHTLVNLGGPWRAQVLAVDLRCHALQAVKGGPSAVGRRTTSQLLAAMPASSGAVAAVNADFFLFAPPGVPTNAHIEAGRVLSGPDARPVVWVGDNGAIGFDTLRLYASTLATPKGDIPLTAWNRPAARTNGFIDAQWGAPLDSLVRPRSWRLVPAPGILHRTVNPGLMGRFVVRALRPTDSTARGDTLLVHVTPAYAARLADGDSVTLTAAISGTGPARAEAGVREAVGGRPLLVADSAIVRDVDTEGAESFRNLNPRTFLGLDRRGHSAWLVVVDGRQAGYSMGMTLRQQAELMLALGASRALNLDGGGSSALVLRRPDGSTRVVNRPSDPTGERPVGNALVVRQTCR